MQSINYKHVFKFLFCLNVVLTASFFTYWQNYQQPSAFFWDENYHIASAQKYLNRVFFMEQHPPLGKLLIALGEKLLNANQQNDSFINSDYAKDMPKGFSFAGYRFFPTLSAWLNSGLFFAILLLATNRYVLSLSLSSLYIFENANIVHSRSAMLEGPLLFFIDLAILLFLLAWKFREHWSARNLIPLFFGISLGCAISTKLTGLILLILLPASFFIFRDKVSRFLAFAVISTTSALLAIAVIWQIHFSLGERVIGGLPNEGYYGASEELKDIIDSKESLTFENFFCMLRDSVSYVATYNKGVPRLDLCKPDENGSPFFLWPVGGRSINYRWEEVGSQSYRYLYLQVNPAIWLCGLMGVLLTVALLLSDLLFVELRGQKSERNYFLIITFLSLYLAYMLAMSRFERVMYLYHYFPALIFSFILFALAVGEIKSIAGRKLGATYRLKSAIAFILITLGCYCYYYPLTYYQPISNKDLRDRAILSIWDLRCAKCERNNYTLTPKS
ncbi:MAG: phospholipid carrier-dependent glycosyltransferase [Deltaproteobacteria bacterium]|nr:phospholipid carrier-dependent glycosyltransferase [Deltaproteobacteria bacterium]